MFDPITTYRVQFNKDFTFRDFRKRIPYLKNLGITTIYASPVFEAVPGSTHGYDVVNPNRINPEIGTEEELRSISKLLKENGMYWLQDIVPNHTAFHPRNVWLMDFLEKGQQSCYHHFFDITGATDFFSGRLMVPFLGRSLEEVIQEKELKLHWNGANLVFQYFDQHYPLNPESYPDLLQFAPTTEALLEFTTQVQLLDEFEDAKIYSERWHELLIQFRGLMKQEALSKNVKAAVRTINADRSLLHHLSQKQHYRLCHWQETEQRINYRRFFTINGLICLNIQHADVFDAHHELVLKLVNENIFDGLRIDHIDGLYHPTAYLQRLRQAVGDRVYITVEKILAHGEQLPEEWPVQGATGYEFLAQLNQLLVNKKNTKAFNTLYQRTTGDNIPVEEQVLAKKRLILEKYMQGEWENLFNCLLETGFADEKQIHRAGAEHLKTAVGELLVHLPVYRYYENNLTLAPEARRRLREIFSEIKNAEPALTPAVHLLQKAFLRSSTDEKISNFYRRCMQYAGPLMAKGVEDTLMYSFNRFLLHNEVGDHPGAPTSGVQDFHAYMMRRRQMSPLALNATATHDTKRGEDARARLQVLSDLPEEWAAWVERWNREQKKWFRDTPLTHADGYLLYQAMIAHLPLNQKVDDVFLSRLDAYIEKALREAKLSSDWSQPNLEYEDALKLFAKEWMQKNLKAKLFQRFFHSLADHGMLHGLHQLVLKFTCPGVPDVYQGTEWWDHSFVDPDNRRPVDYQSREEKLADLEMLSPAEVAAKLWQERSGSDIKLFVLKMLTQLRQQDSNLWTEGEYIPLQVTGRYKDHVLCFARKRKQKVAVVAVPLHVASVSASQNKKPLEIEWKNTAIVFPESFPDRWNSLFAEQEIEGKKILAKELFATWPFAVLQHEQEQELQRSAGVLLSITSLPGRFGIGDVGPEARRFAHLLQNGGQSWWQILPVNPIEGGQGYSPYSASSGMAGNPLLISPDLLVQDGFLSPADLQEDLPEAPHVDYAAAEKFKSRLLQKAFSNFKKSGKPHQQLFLAFCRNEKDWLDDFADYTIIKKIQKGKPWYQWPEDLRLRRKGFQNFLSSHQRSLEEVKWQQYIFFRQWNQLKMFCHRCGIRIIGDLPFYVSYDSADVWANREIFALDKEGNITGVAGVPPDAFSDDGQLWGMPVYHWPAVQKTNFRWWKERIAINLRLYDLVRIDHFRALESYWVVPPGESTAKNGQWQKAPGWEWLRAMHEHFGRLPFLAEDLGDVDDAVFRLRDDFGLPGMKVLQFAFGDHLPHSPHIPHNFVENAVVYTGTHDNNTTRGWYENDLSPATKKQVALYTGCALSSETVSEQMIRMAYHSVAKLAIIPLQDVLSLDHTCRINTPASARGNWTWRLQSGAFSDKTAAGLKQLTALSRR